MLYFFEMAGLIFGQKLDMLEVGRLVSGSRSISRFNFFFYIRDEVLTIYLCEFLTEIVLPITVFRSYICLKGG